MKIKNLKDFMRKNILKNDTTKNQNHKQFRIIPFVPEILKYT